MSLRPRRKSVTTLTLLAVAACGGRASTVASDSGNSGTTSGLAASTAGGSGASSIGASGNARGGASGSAANGSGVGDGAAPPLSCPPTFYPHGDGGCACAFNAFRSVTITFPDGDAQTAFSSDGGTCTGGSGYDAVCTDDAGSAQCVDTNTDTAHCGGCEVSCKPAAACNGGACSAEPTQLVAPAPGCISIHLAYENDTLYWADLGHGTLQSISASGGSITTMASGLHFAAIQQPPNSYPATFGDDGYTPLEFPGQQAVGAAILVHSGTVYWIGSADSITLQSYPSPDDPSGEPVTYPTGGVGTSILSITSGGAPTVLLPTALIPPASAVSVAAKLEIEGTPPFASAAPLR